MGWGLILDQVRDAIDFGTNEDEPIKMNGLGFGIGED
jgi:hypothetical protein